VLGHKASDCPKDPNIRSTFDIEEELKRIMDIRLRKKQESSFEFNELIATVYRERMKRDSFDLGYGSSITESMNSEEGSDRPFPPATNFAEIAEMKSDCPPNPEQNLLQIAQFTSKEAEKEQLINKRVTVMPPRSDGRKETLMGKLTRGLSIKEQEAGRP